MLLFFVSLNIWRESRFFLLQLKTTAYIRVYRARISHSAPLRTYKKLHDIHICV